MSTLFEQYFNELEKSSQEDHKLVQKFEEKLALAKDLGTFVANYLIETDFSENSTNIDHIYDDYGKCISFSKIIKKSDENYDKFLHIYNLGVAGYYQTTNKNEYIRSIRNEFIGAFFNQLNIRNSSKKDISKLKMIIVDIDTNRCFIDGSDIKVFFYLFSDWFYTT